MGNPNSMHNNVDYLQVQNLTFERADRELIRDLSFSLGRGSILQITGANGIGKTTLLRILAGFIPITAGNIYWFGKSIKSCADFRSCIAYLGHRTGITLGLTPRENLRFAAALHAINSHSIDDLLQQFQLIEKADVPAIYLSAGQQRRIALASLPLRAAKVWLLDEPYTALDHSGIHLIEQLLHAHIMQGGLAILTTHQPIKLESLPLQYLELLG